MTPRKISTSTYFTIIRQFPKPALIGGIFTTISLVILSVFWIFLFSAKAPYEKYEYKEIVAQGIPLKAKITGISTKYNTTINNEHPAVISYAYDYGGKQMTDKMQVLAPDKVAQMAVGDEVNIKKLREESVLAEMEPFRFPFFVFLLLPVIFLIIGLTMLGYVFVKVKNRVHIYKYGKTAQARIVAIQPYYYSRSSFGNVPKNVIINYVYDGRTNHNVFGTAITDMRIMAEKKVDDMIDIFISEDETESCIITREEAIKNGWRI